jgi:hypothetical protein
MLAASRLEPPETMLVAVGRGDGDRLRSSRIVSGSADQLIAKAPDYQALSQS